MYQKGEVVGLVGLQFGDEGKGKLVDLLSSKFDYVVRYQGGDNAGHTIYYNGQKCVLRSVPSGIFNTSAIIAPGTAVNPFLFLEEISQLEALLGNSLRNRLFLATQANVIFEFHIEWDRLCEKLRAESKIGSTLRGIGPAYSDKSARIGLKFSDLSSREKLRERLELNLKLKNPIFERYGFKTFELEEVLEKYLKVAESLKPYLVEYHSFISKKLESGASFLLEGSQGLLLDIDLGTYPFVTSSNIVSSISHGGYFPLSSVKSLIGSLKVYTTRVGSGPLLTELDQSEREIENLIRERGHEYGSNTARPRRIGWLDLNALKYSISISGVDRLALSLVDVFSNLSSPIKVCVAYENQAGERLSYSEALAQALNSENLQPIYREFKAWREDYKAIKSFEEFSPEFKSFISFLESELQLKISIISFGKNKEEHIFRD